MDTRLLDDVLVLLDEGNLSRAAMRRNVTQPAFSRRIRIFEDWVGIPLLHREANRVSLLPGLAGNAAEIRATIQRIEAMRLKIRDGGKGVRRLVLATQHALAVSLIPAAITAIRQQEPSVVVRLRTMNREDGLSFFVRGDADILIVYEARGFPSIPFETEIQRRTWMRDTLVPVCGGSLRHDLGADGVPRGPFPIVHYPVDSHFGRLVDRNDRLSRMTDLGGFISVETAFSLGAMHLALSGLGVAWVPHSLCVRAISSGDLVNLSGAFGQIPLDVSLFHATGNTEAERFLARL